MVQNLHPIIFLNFHIINLYLLINTLNLIIVKKSNLISNLFNLILFIMFLFLNLKQPNNRIIIILFHFKLKIPILIFKFLLLHNFKYSNLIILFLKLIIFLLLPILLSLLLKFLNFHLSHKSIILFIYLSFDIILTFS